NRDHGRDSRGLDDAPGCDRVVESGTRGKEIDSRGRGPARAPNAEPEGGGRWIQIRVAKALLRRCSDARSIGPGYRIHRVISEKEQVIVARSERPLVPPEICADLGAVRQRERLAVNAGRK